MASFRNILLPVDSSELTARFAIQVTALRTALNARVSLVHVRTKSHPFDPASFSNHLPFETILNPEGLDNPAQGIVEAAKSIGADLIMMSCRHAGGWRHVFRPSLTAQVLDRSSCAVWIAQGKAADVVNFGSIACCVDLGGDSKRVLLFAGALREDLNAGLDILHVLPDREEQLLSLACLDDLPATLSPEIAQRELQRLQFLAGVHGETFVESGGVPSALSGLARRRKAGLMVIGPGVPRMGRLGSSVLRIVRHAPCPVLVAGKLERMSRNSLGVFTREIHQVSGGKPGALSDKRSLIVE